MKVFIYLVIVFLIIVLMTYINKRTIRAQTSYNQLNTIADRVLMEALRCNRRMWARAVLTITSVIILIAFLITTPSLLGLGLFQVGWVKRVIAGLLLIGVYGGASWAEISGLRTIIRGAKPTAPYQQRRAALVLLEGVLFYMRDEDSRCLTAPHYQKIEIAFDKIESKRSGCAELTDETLQLVYNQIVVLKDERAREDAAKDLKKYVACFDAVKAAELDADFYQELSPADQEEEYRMYVLVRHSILYLFEGFMMIQVFVILI